MSKEKSLVFRGSSNMFDKEYPHLEQYGQAILQSFWIPEHFNYDRDITDFKVNLEPHEQKAVKRIVLMISQIENKVKNMWSRIDMRLPHVTIANTGHIFAMNECYSDDTEVLTLEGFKFFKDITFEDKVAQYNLNTKEITFTKPEQIIKKDFKGKMHRYKGGGKDFKITPKHEIITKHPSTHKVTKNKSEEGVWSRNYLYPVSGYLKSEKDREITPIERMLISLQADGSVFGTTPSGKEAGRRDVSWSLFKKDKIKRLTEILDDTGLKYFKRKQYRKELDKFFTVFSLRLPDWVVNEEIKTFGWVEPGEYSEKFADSFMEELSYWDACVKGSNIVYYNTNEEAIEKIQRIAVLNGFTAYKSINRTEKQSLKVRKPDGTNPKTAKTTYRLSIRKADERVYPKRIEEEYDGKVYCVTVPEGNIVTRRNGSVTIQGNCVHQNAYKMMLDMLGLKYDFDKMSEIPVVKGRTKYLSKYLKGINSASDKEFTKSLILFTLLIENTALFSYFAAIASLNRYKNVFNNFSSIVSTTGREEILHGQFGAELIKIIHNENPEWFDEEMEDKIIRNAKKAMECEEEIIDWVFEEGEFEFLPKEHLKSYLKDRFNKSLVQIGYEPVFEFNKEDLKTLDFFDVAVSTSISFDFFNEKSSEYSETNRVNEEDWNF